MLNFVCGRACSGKTQQIIDRIALESNERRVLLIVPEQFSFESEREVIKRDNANVENITVLSFTRLFNEVVEKAGRGFFSCVSDFEKIIIMKKAMKACQDNLQIFGRFLEYKEMPEKLYDAICELKYAGVNSDELMKIGEELGGRTGAKFKDISLIMTAYDALITSKYIDPADMLTKLFDILCDFNFFGGMSVYFDSFTGFTGQQYKIITKIIEQADNVTFAFTTDEPDNLSIGLFYNVNSAIAKIKNIAKNRGVTDINTVTLENSYYSNSSMKALECLLSDNCGNKEAKAFNNVNIISCDNPRDEALAAANIINKLVSCENYRFKDFILVSRNADSYQNNIIKQCELNDISCFTDSSVRLFDTPLCIYLVSLFGLTKAFTTDNILKLIKLKLLCLTNDEISELEDYVYIWDIKGSDWNKQWVMSVRGLQTEQDSEEDISRLNRINQTRSKVMAILNGFKETFAGAPKQRAAAVYQHITENNIDKNLKLLCDKFEEYGNHAYSSLIKQSWDKIINILDSVVRVLGENMISNDEFIDSFELACSSAKISNVPQMLDEVTFGSAEKIRPSKPKVSIILGANQGIFPQIWANSGILSENDKEKLAAYDIIIDDGAIKGAIEENYLVYSLVCCPVDRVFILYSRKSPSCDELEPSTFIKKIIDNFDDLCVHDFKFGSQGEFVPRTAKSAFSEIGRFSNKAFAEIKESLIEEASISKKLENIENSTENFDFGISSENAAKLFGKNIRLSATKFDTYHRCSLSYFIKSGLRANVIRKADLNVLQRGTIAHYVLEKIIEKYHEDIANLTEIQISAEVDRLINEYFMSVNGSDMLMTARFAYLLSKIAYSIKQIVIHLSNEFAQSGFKPKYCELSIGEDADIPQLVVSIDDSSNVVLDGKIDRVDVFENNVRVVDYKTGRLKFELSDTLYGLNMQMLLYLYTFIKNGNRLVDEPNPAGILYMPAKTSNNSNLRMNGLISSEESIRTAMEKDNSGVYIPKYKDGSNDYIDSDMFELIFKKIEKLLVSMGANVKNGCFDANPTDGVNSNACMYCDFKSICRSSDIKHNTIEKISNEKVMEILKAEVNE